MKESFILYNSFYKAIKHLSDEQLGKLLRAIFNYSSTGEVTEDTEILTAFLFIKNQLDLDNEKYLNICERNRINGQKGGRPKKPKKPSGLSGNPKKPKKPDNDNDNDNDNYINININNKKENNKKKRFGKYERILLTEDEYQKLINDFGEEKIKQQIEDLDEYVEANNNKNKYTNFNLVLRRSIRDNWFKNSKKETSDEVKLIREGTNTFRIGG